MKRIVSSQSNTQFYAKFQNIGRHGKLSTSIPDPKMNRKFVHQKAMASVSHKGQLRNKK